MMSVRAAHHQEAISLKTAVLECWPEANILVAIRAIKAGEISYGYHACSASSLDEMGAVNDAVVTQSVHWRVERRHGKRILEMNTAAVAASASAVVHSDNGTLPVNVVLLLWKDDCRIVPPLPRFVAMHKPTGIITTMREGKILPLEEEEDDDDDDDDDEVVLHSSSSSPESRPSHHCETGAHRPTTTTSSTPPCSMNIVPHDAKGSCLSESNSTTPRNNMLTTVYDLLRQCLPEHGTQHLRAIGRLDKNTEGLLLFTTRGSWISARSAPTRHCPKRYRCTLLHAATLDDLRIWQSGTLQFRDAKSRSGFATARPALDAQFVVETTVPPSPPLSPSHPLPLDGTLAPLATSTTTGLVVDVTIVEGRYRQVRRCWEALRGNRVIRLQRLSYGPIELVLDHEMDNGSALASHGTNVPNPDCGTHGATMPIHVPYGECRELSPAHVAALLPWVRAAA
jgi:pseudouridine synthase